MTSPSGPAPHGTSPPVADFSTLDFDRLWAGRSRVTQVERLTIQDALALASPSRVLEIGAGAGRLSPTIQESVREYAAVDITPGFLARVPLRGGVVGLRVAANVYHLPFVDGAFPAAVMVRVLGFLEDPRAALDEIRRVLAPGGLLVVSYNPRPSVATLVDDLKVGLSRRRGERMESMTFTRRRVVRVRPSSFPAWSLSRPEFRRVVATSGLRWVGERPTGFEEYPGLRWLPAGLYRSLSHAASNAGGFPTRFALLRSPDRVGATVPPWSGILACPACREPLLQAPPGETAPRTCGKCGRTWPWQEGILDARWGERGPGDA
jgi:SAM-dependent methyltransferase